MLLILYGNICLINMIMRNNHQFLGSYFDGHEAMVYGKTHNNCNHKVFNQFTYYLVKNPLFQESIENEVFPNKMHYIAQNSTSTKSIN